MDQSKNPALPRARGSLTIAFFVLFGAVLAFVIGQRVGTSLDHHGRTITFTGSGHAPMVAHDHVAPVAPVAQK